MLALALVGLNWVNVALGIEDKCNRAGTFTSLVTLKKSEGETAAGRIELAQRL